MAEDLPPRGGPRPRPAKPARGGSGTDTGWAVIGTMLSGMAVWGGAGWLLDRWLDTKGFRPVAGLQGARPGRHPAPERGDHLPVRGQVLGRRPAQGEAARNPPRRTAR